jgi:hypothetical protein
VGEGGSNREIVNGVVKKLENLVVPSRNDSTRGSNRRLENEMSEGRR